MTYHSRTLTGADCVVRVWLSKGRRNVLLALLSGAENLHRLRLCDATGAWPASVHLFLDHLVAAGWADKHRRKVGLKPEYCYALTDEGRMRAAAELSLILPDVMA